MSKYACVDVGGIFTDAAVLDERGEVHVFKSPTTPHDWTEGILGALKVASEYYKDFLKDISVENGGLFTYGSTISTNAIVEKSVAKSVSFVRKVLGMSSYFERAPTKIPLICS